MNHLVIDGSHGEGGGQILRSALTLAMIVGRPLRLENIRAGRKQPGLAAQHLTCVRAAASLCNAHVVGAELGSQALEFAPRDRISPGEYDFDVAEARLGGSAGAVMLVLQTILLPLALAGGDSCVILRGGTHVKSSPSFDYIRDVWLPMLARMGVHAGLSLIRAGWYPLGGGEVRLCVEGMNGRPRALCVEERGNLQTVRGKALTAKLPAHIAQRMADRARACLKDAGIAATIETVDLRAACAGAGLFLTAVYEQGLAGFNALGERGKPAERVADEACAALLCHYRSGAAIEEHLADQLIVPAALGDGRSVFSVERVTRHLATNAWVVERFGLAEVEILPAAQGTATVTIRNCASRMNDCRHRLPGY